MKTKVLEVLKPKAASFGFNEEELSAASESIAGGLKGEATAEDIAAAVDAALPYLKLSQSAANRSFERYKEQFAKEHPTKTKEQEEAERKAKEDAERKAKEAKEAKEKAEKEEPEWFKAYRKSAEKEIQELKDANAKLATEKANEGFRSRAVKALEGVDESFYGLLLKDRLFKDNDEVDTFVGQIKEQWDKMSKKFKLDKLAEVRPPKTGAAAGDKPSAEVTARIERRKKESKVAAPIRGLDKA